MPRFIRYDTAKEARSVKRTKNCRAFIIVTKAGQTYYYPNSSYNNSVVCAARPKKTLKKEVYK